MTSPALVVDAVSIRRPDATVPLPGSVSLEVAPGEVVLILGPSGCGKSTLALACNGLLPATVPATINGSIRVSGIDSQSTAVADLSQHVGMVFQDPDAQIVTSRVFDEVCFAPENHLLDAEQVTRTAERALRSVGLWQVRDARPEHLSGGQRQRLAIACAIAMSPALLVLDEPTANLDSRSVEEFYSTLRALVTSTSTAIVLIEHNLDAAVELVDRVVVLDKSGTVACSGTPTEVLTGHASDLLHLGVWLPVPTLAALRLIRHGVTLDPLPLSPAELGRALDATAVLPEPALTEPRRPPKEAIVSVTDLHVSRDRHVVLNGLNLTVRRGELLAVIGANGAGKSTLLHVLAGLDRTTRRGEVRGEVRVAGHDPARLSAARLSRTLGFVFQNPEHQLIRRTVEDELAHSLRILQPRPSEEAISARVEQMLEQLSLTHLRHRHPFTLSGGQKRRLSVGTSLIAGAEVLLLDEPTYGQDLEHAAALMAMLNRLREREVTIIMATHDLQLVAENATEIAILNGGVITGHGRTEQMLRSDQFAATGHVLPPLARAMRGLENHPAWRTITRLRQIPGDGE